MAEISEDLCKNALTTEGDGRYGDMLSCMWGGAFAIDEELPKVVSEDVFKKALTAEGNGQFGEMLSCMWELAEATGNLSPQEWCVLARAFARCVGPHISIIRARTLALEGKAAAAPELKSADVISIEIGCMSGDVVWASDIQSDATTAHVRNAMVEAGIEGTSLVEGGCIVSGTEILDETQCLSNLRSMDSDRLRLMLTRDATCLQACLDLRQLCEHALRRLSVMSRTVSRGTCQVLCSTMQGDCSRFLAESFQGEMRHSAISAATACYASAFSVARMELPWCESGCMRRSGVLPHSPRLQLCLNYSVHMQHMLNENDKAIKMAREAFEGALLGLDPRSGNDEPDDILMMQKLRDNVFLWTNDHRAKMRRASDSLIEFG
jgi:hypothetical protein